MPILDIATLLKPIPGDDPGGPPPNQVRDKEARDPTNLARIRNEAKEKRGDAPTIDSLPVNDPMRIKHWRDGMKLAQDLFSTRSKSLDWAIYVVDTATRSGGLAGAREGFQFLTKLANDLWSSVWPRPNLAEIEAADPEERESVRREQEGYAAEGRAGRFQSLDDAGSGLLYPNVLRELILAEQDGVSISVFSCRGAEGKAAKHSIEEVQSVARKIGADGVKAILTEVDGALADLEAMRQAVEARFVEANAGDLAPSFREVRLALEDCRKVADDMYAAVETVDEPGGGDATASGDSSGEAAPSGGGGGGSGKGEKITRAGLYKQISQIADHLTRLEPHSPVPFLLRRVVEMQDLPFPQLVREFTKTSESVLEFLARSLPESPTGE
ncbi:MAG: type VI secretion system ImpA family N-terminal domain-containing protein [Gemmataceae bacterium]